MSKAFLVKRFLIFIVASLVICLLIYYKQYIESFRIDFERIAYFKLQEDVKYVLYFSPFWNTWDYQLGYGFKPFQTCEYKNCYATDNRSLLPLDEYDALIFHASYNKGKHGVPSIRSPHQIYIFMNWEAPVYICPNLKQYNHYFNWTMSYRFDSDIVRRHGYVFKEETTYEMPSAEFLKNKTKLGAWFVSNCRTRSKRELLGKELTKYMQLDIYGNCGKLQCPRKKGNGKISSVECYEMIEEKYKFYLSFENSYCRDYSTEKLYNILSRNLVPVVYGFGDYKLSAPPNSVINVENFQNASDLADYLKYLNENDEEYLKYFEWKKHYRVSTHLRTSACQICKKLNEKPLKESIYHNLHEWWWGKNKSICKVNKALPVIVSSLDH